jgi:uncharacterized membrane protein YjfL (UPF0719 family)
MQPHLEAWMDLQAIREIFSPGFIQFLIALVFILPAKSLLGLTTRYPLNSELTEKDNKAVAVATAGFIAATFIVAHGVMTSNPSATDVTWLQSVIDTALWTAITLSLVLASAWINRRMLLHGIDLHHELIHDQNIGAGAVLAGTYIGTAIISGASVYGTTGAGLGIEILDTLVYFVIGQFGFLLMGKWYARICGFDFKGALRDDNAGAGIAFGTTLVALAILIAGQIRRSDSLPALIVWIPLAALLLTACRHVADLVMLPKARFGEEIARDHNWGVSILEAATAIGCAILLNTAMSGLGS